MASTTPRLVNKVAVITGGGTGIGRATALLYAREGASVVLLGRRAAPLEETVESIVRQGGQGLPIATDATDANKIGAALRQTLASFKQIDVLVNNAGVPGQYVPIHETSDRVWQEVTNGNLTSCFCMTRAVLPHFLDRKRG
jgi:NADP-dependent 3-hydroxy acid dehydrogenase YdfG